MQEYQNFINIKNEEIYCYVSSIISDNKILFIHGAGGNADVWKSQWNFFKNKYSVVIPDLPCHYRSKGLQRKTIRDYSFFIMELLSFLDINQIIIVGHSMGGAIALDFALNFSDITSALILIGTGARLKVSHQIIDIIEKNYDMFCDYSESLRDVLKKTNPTVTKGDFLACDVYDVMDKISNIKLPSLIICGREDFMTPLKYSIYLNEKINGSILKVVEGAGHSVMLEKPDEVNRYIEEFASDIHPVR